MTEPDRLALEVAARVRDAVVPHLGSGAALASVSHARPAATPPWRSTRSPNGCVEDALAAEGDIGFYSEDRGLVTYGRPRAFLVIDPVDGTRPAAAGLESCCVSIAVVPPSEDARLGDVSFGVVHELKTGQRFWASRGERARRGARRRASRSSSGSPPTPT